MTQLVMVLPDGTTYAGLEGSKIVAVDDDHLTEIEAGDPSVEDFNGSEPGAKVLAEILVGDEQVSIWVKSPEPEVHLYQDYGGELNARNAIDKRDARAGFLRDLLVTYDGGRYLGPVSGRSSAVEDGIESLRDAGYIELQGTVMTGSLTVTDQGRQAIERWRREGRL